MRDWSCHWSDGKRYVLSLLWASAPVLQDHSSVHNLSLRPSTHTSSGPNLPAEPLGWPQVQAPFPPCFRASLHGCPSVFTPEGESNPDRVLCAMSWNKRPDAHGDSHSSKKTPVPPRLQHASLASQGLRCDRTFRLHSFLCFPSSIQRGACGDELGSLYILGRGAQWALAGLRNTVEGIWFSYIASTSAGFPGARILFQSCTSFLPLNLTTLWLLFFDTLKYEIINTVSLNLVRGIVVAFFFHLRWAQ